MDKSYFDLSVERRGTDSKKYSPDFFAEDVIPLWIADTDFLCPPEIIETVTQRANAGVYGYPNNNTDFAAAAQNWLSRRFGLLVDTCNVQSVPGTIHGVICTLRAVTNPGDGVLIQTPAYPPFYEAIRKNNRTIVSNELELINGHYEIDFSSLEKALARIDVKAMILCNPHNPTGRVFTKAELQRISELCLRYGVFVIADEIHADIVYKPNTHIPYASLSKAAAKNSVLCINPSKTFNIAGLRTAAVISFDSNIQSRVSNEIAANKTYGRNIFGAAAFVTAYTRCDEYADLLIEYLADNLKMVREKLSPLEGISLVEPEGTYLLWLDCRDMGLTQAQLKSFFANKAKVGLNDGTTFGDGGIGFMRLNIGCQAQTLERALNNIVEAYVKWKEKTPHD